MNFAGRPSVISKFVVAKLVESLRLGFTDTECCQYAEIDRSTFYRHIQNDQNFASQIAVARNYAKLKCCSVPLEAIESKNVQVCQWWLERKYPQEFGRNNSSKLLVKTDSSVWDRLREQYTIHTDSQATIDETDNNCHNTPDSQMEC